MNEDKGELMSHLIALAKSTGDEVMKYRKHKDLSVHRKGDGLNDFFSQADTLSHTLLTTGLRKLGAQQILSEESIHESLDRSEDVWIIDPIDGTKAFVSGENQFSILISRYRNGDIDVGVAHFPALGELYYAYKGGGCRVQGIDGYINQINVSDQKSGSYKIQVRPERSKDEKEVRTLHTYLEQKEGVITYVIVGYDTRNVLIGNIDYFIESYPKIGKRDIGPSQILIQEAGFYMGDIRGNPINFTQKDSIFTTPILIGKKEICAEVVNGLKNIASNIKYIE